MNSRIMKTLRGAVVALLLLCSQGGYAQFCEQDSIYYDVVSFSDYTLEVIKRPKGFYHGDVVVPSQVTVNGKQWTVVRIGDNAFQLCSTLTSVTLPETITSIGVRAFQYVPLTSITLPNSVKTIESSAFQDCLQLQSLTLSASLKQVPDLMCWKCPMLKSVVIPDGVTSIGDYAFYCCSSMQKVTIPNSVTSIGIKAFEQCGQLVAATLPPGLTSVSKGLFSNCIYLQSVSLPEGLTSIADSAFFACSYLSDVAIPASVTSIGSYAFCVCSKLSSVTLPEGLSEISPYSFYSTGLTELVIPSGVAKIGVAAFRACSDLEEVVIPASVSYLGGYSFSRCESLRSVTIPSRPSLTIGTTTFEECKALAAVYLGFKEPQPITSCFNADVSTIYVPRGSLQAYKDSEYGWADFQLDEYDPADDTGIELPAGMNTVRQIYSLGGLRRTSLGKGLNILRMSDGTTRKVMEK